MSVPTSIDGERTTETIVLSSYARAQADRLAVRIETAQRALVQLRAVDAMPLASRDVIDRSVGEVARALAQLRRSLRALGADLGAMETEGRALVARVFERRAGRAT